MQAKPDNSPTHRQPKQVAHISHNGCETHGRLVTAFPLDSLAERIAYYSNYLDHYTEILSDQIEKLGGIQTKEAEPLIFQRASYLRAKQTLFIGFPELQERPLTEFPQ